MGNGNHTNCIFTSSIVLDQQWSTYLYWWYSSDSWLYIRDSTRVRWTVIPLSTLTVSSRFLHQHLDEDSNVRQWFKSSRFAININITSFNIMMSMSYKNYHHSLSVNIILQNMRISFTKLNINSICWTNNSQISELPSIWGVAKIWVFSKSDPQQSRCCKASEPRQWSSFQQMSIVPVAVSLHVFNRGVELTNMDDTSIWEVLMAVTWTMILMYDIRINHVLWHKMKLYWR